MKLAISDIDRNRIGEAVAAAETRTSVEIRLVLAQSSSHYAAFELIYPMLLALIAGGVIAALRPGLDAGWLFMVEIGVLIVSGGALQWPAVRHALVPSVIKKKAAWRSARLQYADIGLRNTGVVNALLLFCSVSEHYVEILVDDSIVEVLPDTVWTPIVTEFSQHFAKGAIVDAFVTAVDACATALEPKFPRRAGVLNTLPDSLVEL